MLVLSRKEGESITLPEVNVEVRVIGLRRSKVQLGIQAPKEITVSRGEQPQRVPSHCSQAEHQRLTTELARLEADVIALAELAGAQLSGNRDHNAGRIAADAIERLGGIKRSIHLASPARTEPKPISELVTVRTEVIDRLRIGQPDEVQPTDYVRQSSAGYLVLSRNCNVA
jgi:carbon storage regulator CsrA